jgi:hypothetical protein
VGYYIQLSGNRKKNGMLGTCRPPCKTCEKNEKNCLSCVANYTLNGTQCLGDSRVVVTMVLKGDDTPASILDNTASAARTLYSGSSNINRIFNALCKKLPSAFDVSTPLKCYDALKLSFLGAGSIRLGNSVVGGNYSSPEAALSAISAAFASGSAFDGGILVLSSSFEAKGYTTTPVTPATSTSNVNLALVLGLSIPLTVLRTFCAM